MKLSHFLSALFLAASETSVVRAADCASVALLAIPSCAQSCFLNGASSVGCSGTDFTCQCEQEAKLYAAIEGCVATGCPSASYQAVIDGASSVCGCATAGLGGGTVSSLGSYTVGSYTVGSSFYTTSAKATATATATASATGTGAPTATVSASAAFGALQPRVIGLSVAAVLSVLASF